MCASVSGVHYLYVGVYGGQMRMLHLLKLEDRQLWTTCKDKSWGQWPWFKHFFPSSKTALLFSIWRHGRSWRDIWGKHTMSECQVSTWPPEDQSSSYPAFCHGWDARMLCIIWEYLDLKPGMNTRWQLLFSSWLSLTIYVIHWTPILALYEGSINDDCASHPVRYDPHKCRMNHFVAFSFGPDRTIGHYRAEFAVMVTK